MVNLTNKRCRQGSYKKSAPDGKKDTSNAVPSDRFGAKVPDAAAARATTIVVIVVQYTRQAQQFVERMKR